MKSLSGIVSSQTRSAREESTHTSSREQAIRSCLPIAVTALLMIFIGGFPPTTWVLLFQTFGQLNTLLTYEGPGLILPLMILIVQSLLLLAAWLLLGWVILREGTYLMTMQSKAELDRLLAFQSATGELINLSQMVTKQLPVEQDLDEVLETLEEEKDDEDDGVTTSSLMEEEPEEDSWTSRSIQSKNVQSRGMSSKRVESRTAHVQSRNMPSKSAHVESHDLSSKSATSKSAHVQSRGMSSKRVESRTAHVQSRGMSSKSAHVQLHDVPPRTARSPRVELDNIQSHKQKSHNLQSHRTLSSRRGSSTERLLEEKLLENPFEGGFEKDLPLTPQIEDNVKQNKTKTAIKKEELPPEEEDDDDNPFVYGNPFDGPLPEVFKYDAELRRSILELKEEESGAPKAKRS